ncbi:MAG: NAD(P)/FAD-dependent oxidoreductase [Pseudomonadota bacterium]
MVIQTYDVLILGAGAAGMICAIEAGKRGRRTIVLDHSEKIGRKILISGGGRCNFTNLHVSPDHYVSNNPPFVRSALARFTPADFVTLVERHRIQYHEKKDGQLFCDGPARAIVQMLTSECASAGVTIQPGTKIRSVSKKDRFLVRTSRGDFESESLVVATGGLSIPKSGATDFGYQLARQFGHAVTPTAPALDGFLFGPNERKFFGDLAGLSIDAAVSCDGRTFREPILFTHSGLSGPGALQASLYWSPGLHVTIDFVPGSTDRDLSKWLLEAKESGNRSEVRNLLAQFVPKRFAEAFCASRKIAGPLLRLSNPAIERICRSLREWSFVPETTVGYGKAEVTRGGVDTRELSSKTMESRKTPGLFFIGEVVDVTGQLGGFNFQWAWSSGSAAGQAV